LCDKGSCPFIKSKSERRRKNAEEKGRMKRHEERNEE
jgi:hypothetical protein